MSRKRAWLVGLAAVALAARVAFCIRFSQALPDGGVQDLDWYHHLATTLSERGSLLDTQGRPTAMREPLYPLVLAGVYSVIGPRYWAVAGLNALLGVVLVLLILKVGERLFDERTGRLAAAIAALHPQLLFYTATPRREILQTLLLFGAAAAALEWTRRKETRWCAISGALGGLAGLANSALLPAGAALAPVSWWLGGKGKKGLRPALALAAALCAVYALWPLRNLAVFGRFIPGITGGGAHLYIGLVVPDDAAGSAEEAKYILADPVLQAASLLPEERRDAAAYKGAARWIMDHPIGFARRLWLSAVKLWRLYPYQRDYGMNYSLVKWTSILSDGWLIPLGLVGLVMAWKKKPETLIFDSMLAAVTATYAVFWAVIRYRLPLMPFVILYAAHAALALTARLRRSSGA